MQLISADTLDLLSELSRLAHDIWREHYTPLIGRQQVEYMLANGSTVEALSREQQAGTRFTLAQQSGQYVGYAACFHNTAQPQTTWLDKLYVHTDARRTGVARHLLSRVVAQAEAWAAEHMRLRVNRHNADSIAAYRRLGFEVEAEDTKDIGHGFVMDDYIMGAPLSRLSAYNGSL